MSQIILEARSVWKVFGKSAAQILRDQGALDAETLRAKGLVVGVLDASFSISRGEIFIIMGLSGSGKSTMLRCLTGLYDVSRGEVSVDGCELSTASPAELVALRREKIGMVFQSFALLPHLSAMDNVAFPLQVTGMDKATRRERAMAALALVGLKGLEHRFPAQMSGGQQQRVGIARSLIADPTVWFLDEPFSALDPLIRRDMQDEFIRLQSQLHKTIVFVTHDLEEAVRLGDRIAIMQDGRVLQIGTPEDVVMNPVNDYVRRFVSGMSKSHVVRVGTIAQAFVPAAGQEPIAASATLHEVMGRIMLSEAPIPVADGEKRIIGSVSRAEVVKWL